MPEYLLSPGVTVQPDHKVYLIFDLQDHIYPVGTPVCYNK